MQAAPTEYRTGQYTTYEAVHVIHLNLSGGTITRKLSAGEQCQFDGSTIVLGDETKYSYPEFRGAIHRGWARPVGSDATPIANAPRTIRNADMTSGQTKHVPKVEVEDRRDVRKVDSSDAVEKFLRDLQHQLEPTTATPPPTGKFSLGSGPTEVRDLSHLSPTTPSGEGKSHRKMALEVHAEQREVGQAAKTGALTMEDSARAVITNPESIATRGSAEIGTPKVSKMEDGSLRIDRKFKTSASASGSIVGEETTPPPPQKAPEQDALSEDVERARYEVVRMFVKGFKWDKDRSPNERVKDALKLKDKNTLKGVLAVEDDIVKGKIAEALGQKAQKGAAIKA